MPRQPRIAIRIFGFATTRRRRKRYRNSYAAGNHRASTAAMFSSVDITLQQGLAAYSLSEQPLTPALRVALPVLQATWPGYSPTRPGPRRAVWQGSRKVAAKVQFS